MSYEKQPEPVLPNYNPSSWDSPLSAEEQEVLDAHYVKFPIAQNAPITCPSITTIGTVKTNTITSTAPETTLALANEARAGGVSIGSAMTAGAIAIGANATTTVKVKGASVSLCESGGTVSLGQTSITTGPTPSIANVTINNDAGALKGCSLQVGRNAGSPAGTYRLLLGSDINHSIYSTDNANQTFFVEYGLGSDTWNFYNAASSSAVATISNLGVYATLSDRNKKKDFEASTLGLNEILQLKPTLFRYKNKTDKTEELDTEELKSVGFIAQEIQSILPQAYMGGTNFIGLDYNAFIPVLVKAVQELKEDYDTKLSEIEARLNSLESA